jgi:AraC-like DNA-binding protein/ligand-binding sensor protein
MKKERMDDENTGAAETVRGGTTETNPVLLKAYKILSDYARATGTMVCVHDHNCMPIPEMFDEINSGSNNCLYCVKYRGRGEIKKLQDLTASPCNEMHVNAIREATHYGGSSVYMCELGFMFWTSPIYTEGRYIGAVLGTGLLGVDREETAALMYQMAGGEVPLETIRERLSIYPEADPERIKALAELMLICAEALSSGSGDYHETLKRRAEQQFHISSGIQELKEKYPAGTPGPGYPLEKERMLLAAIRRGDNENGRKILNELLAALLFSNPGEYRYIQFRAIELVVLLSRADVNPACTEKIILETNNSYLKQIQESDNIEDLTDVLHIVVDRIAGRIFSFQGIRHAAALRKAEHFIWENYTRKISLQEIAAVSGLSAPYFSTIFKEEMGENLSSYLNRLRVEKAAALLADTDLSLSEIAGACGFEDQSWFSKIFKHYTGISPGKYRGQGKAGLEISDSNFSAKYRGTAEPSRKNKEG